MRIPVTAQMFQKVNHKGMAVILHPLLCHFDKKFEDLFDGCWFPYALAEMKDFKQTCFFISEELQKRGLFSHCILNKQVLENAQGSKMW